MQNQKLAPVFTGAESLRALTFDLWGTLFDDIHATPEKTDFPQKRQGYFQQQLAVLGHSFSDEEIRAAYNHARYVFNSLWRKTISFDAGLGISEMLKYLKVEVPLAMEMQLQRYFEEVVNEKTLPLIDGVAPALKRLRGHYRMALISDTAWTPGRVLREHLRRHEILACFDGLIFSDEQQNTKPHASLFEMAHAAVGATAAETLHVGDLKFTDVRGALAVGGYAAWIERPDYLNNAESQDQPTLTVKSVPDLADLLLNGKSPA